MTNELSRRALFAGGASALALGALAACSSPSRGTGTASRSGATTVSYWLWDSNQLPAYQAVADAFHQEHPDITVKITQLGWNDYWTKLTAGFIAGTAPDVFTDHLTKFPQYSDLDVLYKLDELEATKGIRDDDYQSGLAELWKGKDGHRYGSPKDWDTIAMFYDRKAMAKAGVSDADLADLEWNPDDGGSFERMLAHLTVDAKGRRGDEPGFDKHDVAVYGISSNGSGGDGFGQTQWSPFTGSVDWFYTNENPWGDKFRYDEKVVQDTLAWYYGLAEKGYMAKYGVFSTTTGPEVQLGAGKCALSFNGSWMIGSYLNMKDLDIALAPTPVGPIGHRASMFNGLGDSITKQARNPEAAAKWVAFLGSDTAQEIVGKAGIVFPARPAGTEAAVASFRKRGLDVSAFTRQVEEKTTFLFPVTKNPADVQALLQPAFDDVYANGKSIRTLTGINEQVNNLLALT
ncbi:multiple sugar transport system substrate-binding protein [Curtobacterium flaccumfaciens]|uniref:Multiple sugar transport system substrate-binding protein n=1 Tax=Curtobacterium flaccumfaciens TaxID=2035 RepID=A0A4R6DG71_9MICO|nr:sugar ABC transporter substrate-binding protein [Curtobacterium flaccumfaciens]TDN43631.1 multiple sugar transport system substrate-binding protein [Curtobacterium flaccumfaciens]